MTGIAAGFDYRTHKIPNLLTFPGMLAGIIHHTSSYGWDGFVFSAAGLGVGIGLLILPYLMGGMGAGDAKLMGAVGACLGMERTLVAFLFVAAMGCVYGLGVFIIHRKRFAGYFKQLWLTAQMFLVTRKYMPVESTSENRPKVYYGIAIAAGTYIYVILTLNGFEMRI
jgi:prepilin peptidase CpaA